MYFLVIWYILWSFDISSGHLVYFLVILVYGSRFGMLHQEKSGNHRFNQFHTTVVVLIASKNYSR
jgi:hypothetical protein